MLTRLQICAVPAVIVALALVGCTPTPAPEPSVTPSTSESPSASPSEEPAPDPAPEPIAIPDCADIYSPALVASLTAEGRTSSGDVSGPGMGGWGTADAGVETILVGIPERVSCTWILPATESGSTTSIALINAGDRATIVAAFTAGGFTASTTPDGDLYTIDVVLEIGSYNEAHLLTDEVWVGSVFSGGDAQSLTLDAFAQLAP